jgi:hypothetical protein
MEDSAAKPRELLAVWSHQVAMRRLYFGNDGVRGRSDRDTRWCRGFARASDGGRSEAPQPWPEVGLGSRSRRANGRAPGSEPLVARRIVARPEATGNAAAVVEGMAPRVGRVVIANPRQVRLIAEARITTDVIDATVLARLDASGFRPEAWMPDVGHRHCGGR